MPQLRVDGRGWSLLLRWASRPRVQSSAPEPSSLCVEADGRFVVGLSEGLSFEGQGLVERALAEPLLWEPKELSVALEHDEGGAALALWHEDPTLRGAVADVSGRGRALAGTLDLGSRVGFLDLDFRRGGARLVRLRLEVFPSKLSYREDFERMLRDLGGHRAVQILKLLPPTSITRELERRSDLSLVERYQVFEAFLEPVERALRQIARQPHVGLRRVTTPRPTERLRRPDARTRRAAGRGGGRRVEVGGRALPARLPEGHRESTFDTPANRFVARALRSLVALLGLLRAEKGEPWSHPELRERVSAQQQRLRRWLGQDFLRELPDHALAPDLVVQRKPGYRELLKAYRSTLLAFSMLAGDVRMGLQDLWLLYELWCAVRVEQVVGALLGPGEGSLVPVSARRPRLGGVVTFPDGTTLSAQSASRLEDAGGEQRPDLTLELTRPAPRQAGAARFQLILDAKYRLHWKGRHIGPPQGALNAIHRYRDAMLAQGERGARRTVFGGVILFPHPDEQTFMADATSAWQDFERMGVGAVPLVPGQGVALTRWLTRALRASEVQLHRMGPPYPALPPRPRAGTVLVMPLRYGLAQLTQLLEEGWTHVPARVNLAAQRPTHFAPYVDGAVSHLWRIRTWSRVTDDRLSKAARFGGGKACRRPPYWWLELEAHEALEPPLRGDDRGLRSWRFVPLEVFDVADSVFLLRGEARHVDLLRVLRHLRRLAPSLQDGERHLEPLVVDGRALGRLALSPDSLTWHIEGRSGAFTTEQLLKRTVIDVFEGLRRELPP
ncbi:MAG: DUF2357 domain-containing protein [Alphaproteobacteria bacterium]|nr:DUF2357 domain-containing protein [Alphaproteobacteria bacterium]